MNFVNIPSHTFSRHFTGFNFLFQSIVKYECPVVTSRHSKTSYLYSHLKYSVEFINMNNMNPRSSLARDLNWLLESIISLFQLRFEGNFCKRDCRHLLPIIAAFATCDYHCVNLAEKGTAPGIKRFCFFLTWWLQAKFGCHLFNDTFFSTLLFEWDIRTAIKKNLKYLNISCLKTNKYSLIIPEMQLISIRLGQV